MNKIYLDEKSYKFIADWYEEHNIMVDRVPKLFSEYVMDLDWGKDSHIVYKFTWVDEERSSFSVTTSNTVKTESFKFNGHFDYSGMSLLRAKMMADAMGVSPEDVIPENNTFTTFSVGVASVTDKPLTSFQNELAKILLYVHAYVMYFMANFEQELIEYESTEVEKKPPKKTKKKKSKKQRTQSVQVIRVARFVRDVQTGKKELKRHYTKCKHAYDVRGHYRHYKSGKVVWIEGFKKNSGKRESKNDKTYKFDLEKR